MRPAGTYASLNEQSPQTFVSALPVFTGHKNPAFAEELTLVTGDLWHYFLHSTGDGCNFMAYARKEADLENGWSVGVYHYYNGVARDTLLPGAYTLPEAIEKIKAQQPPKKNNWDNIFKAADNAFHYEHVILPTPENPRARVKQSVIPLEEMEIK